MSLTHECIKEAEFATIEAQHGNQERRIDEHHETLFGNGRAGLQSDVHDLKNWREAMSEQRKEERATYLQIKVGIILIILGFGADILFRIFGK